MVMDVFYIDSEHAKDMFQICKWLQGSMRKTWYLHDKWKNPKSRVQGWCTARVRWCTGSGGLNLAWYF